MGHSIVVKCTGKQMLCLPIDIAESRGLREGLACMGSPSIGAGHDSPVVFKEPTETEVAMLECKACILHNMLHSMLCNMLCNILCNMLCNVLHNILYNMLCSI